MCIDIYPELLIHITRRSVHVAMPERLQDLVMFSANSFKHTKPLPFICPAHQVKPVLRI